VKEINRENKQTPGKKKKKGKVKIKKKPIAMGQDQTGKRGRIQKKNLSNKRE